MQWNRASRFEFDRKSMETETTRFSEFINGEKAIVKKAIESSEFISHRARLFDSRKNSHSTKLEQRPWILVKLSFRVLCNSKLSS